MSKPEKERSPSQLVDDLHEGDEVNADAFQALICATVALNMSKAR